MRNKYLLIALTMLCSCSNKNEIIFYDGFSETIPVKSCKIEVPPVLLYPTGLYMLKGKLVVMNEKTDTLFQVFSIPELKHQKQFGIKGQGPEDFILPLKQAVSYTESSFTLCDGNQLKMIDMSSEHPQVTPITLPFDYKYFNGLIKLNDTLYHCYPDFENEHELRILEFGNYPEDMGNYPEEVSPRYNNILERNQAYSRFMIAKPDGSRIAVFYQHIRRYRIYSPEGVLLKDNMLNLPPYQERPNVDDEDRCIHPVNIYATDKYIYTLNYDATGEEIINQKVDGANIQVFDWDGHPIKQYQLDCFISAFTIDEDNGIMYGLFIQDENHIYKFKI